MVVGPCDETCRELAARLILQHTKAEKLPAQALEFRCGTPVWAVDRAQADAWQQQTTELVKLS